MGSYKDSGIEWIGEIPKGWEVNKYKFLGSTKNGLTYTPEDITTESDGILVLRSGNIQNGQLDFNDVVFVNTSIPNNLKLQKNDILITARNGSANLVGKNILINTEINATYGAFMMAFRANRRINPRFAQYTMNPTFDNYKTFFTTSTVNQLTVNIFYNMAVPLPPLQEQAAIADFLDKRNAEIDAIIAKITHQTVTKGLDKTVSYKDSGIEWIGKIPEEWSVIRLKYITDFKTGGTPSDKEGIDDVGDYPWITAKDMDSYQILNPYLSISREVVNRYNYKLFPSKSILMVCIASIGKISLIETESYSNQQITALINSTCNEKFLLYAIVQQMDKIKLDALSNVIPITNTSYLSNINIAVPPRQEQAAIADYLDEKTAKIDNIIAKKEQQLDIIKEHRKSLIYEYVTGKKRVQEYQQDGN